VSPIEENTALWKDGMGSDEVAGSCWDVEGVGVVFDGVRRDGQGGVK
jgi:hypothetical protein